MVHRWLLSKDERIFACGVINTHEGKKLAQAWNQCKLCLTSSKVALRYSYTNEQLCVRKQHKHSKPSVHVRRRYVFTLKCTTRVLFELLGWDKTVTEILILHCIGVRYAEKSVQKIVRSSSTHSSRKTSTTTQPRQYQQPVCMCVPYAKCSSVARLVHILEAQILDPQFFRRFNPEVSVCLSVGLVHAHTSLLLP